jgi:hypothetical protein
VCAYELLIGDDDARKAYIGCSLFNVSALPWFLLQTQQIVGL